MIYGYARVSTAGQAKDGNSLEAQEQSLRDAGATEIYADVFTGKKVDRPELDKLMDRMQRGDTIVVTKMDRFARTLVQGIELIENLNGKGIKVNVLSMGMIDDTPNGKLIRNVLLSFSEYERDMIVQRTQEGKEIARKNPGYREGRPKKYTRTQVNHALDLLNNHSYKQVAEMTGISIATLVREKKSRKNMNESERVVKFIDLFAGIGGIRKGFEIACSERDIKTECVFTSEIKASAVEVLSQNHPGETIYGDITQINENDIPDFDFLLAGFPCQAFSMAGKRLGFQDTRGTLFFDVARILKAKRPKGFVLENVEGLVNHDGGRTFEIILNTLDELGYHVTSKILNAVDFGVPQDRKRIYIVGSNKENPNFDGFEKTHHCLESFLEKGLECEITPFISNLLSHYSVDELEGKSLKDKRGGKDNIHSWDLEMKGSVTNEEIALLNMMMTERRKKRWAVEYGIDWMDGMPLTTEMIRTFYNVPNLEELLEDLTKKKYLVKEHPKKRIDNHREQDTTLPLGYNIVAGKMSFPVNKILDRKSVAPTLVAMDMQHIYVIDGKGIRPLSLREGLRLFGYPDDYKFDVEKNEGYDLLGNTVVVPVITAVSRRLLNTYGDMYK